MPKQHRRNSVTSTKNAILFSTYFLMMDTAVSSFMPIAESTQMAANAADAVNTTFYIRLPMQKLPTTRNMVNDALETLHSARGVSLHKIKKFIEEKYCFDLNVNRKTNMKNYLHDLLLSGDLLNVTGKGLAGSIKLNRQQKSKRSEKTKPISPAKKQQPRQPKLKVALTAAATEKKRPPKQPKKQQNPQPKTPPNKASAMQARRALQMAPAVMVQHADPFAAHGLNRVEVDATPRSSGGVARKRKLQTVNPPIPSQIFEPSSLSDTADSEDLG